MVSTGQSGWWGFRPVHFLVGGGYHGGPAVGDSSLVKVDIAIASGSLSDLLIPVILESDRWQIFHNSRKFIPARFLHDTSGIRGAQDLRLLAGLGSSLVNRRCFLQALEVFQGRRHRPHSRDRVLHVPSAPTSFLWFGACVLRTEAWRGLDCWHRVPGCPRAVWM